MKATQKPCEVGRISIGDETPCFFIHTMIASGSEVARLAEVACIRSAHCRQSM
jgi:hypothetical protein